MESLCEITGMETALSNRTGYLENKDNVHVQYTMLILTPSSNPYSTLKGVIKSVWIKRERFRKDVSNLKGPYVGAVYYTSGTLLIRATLLFLRRFRLVFTVPGYSWSVHTLFPPHPVPTPL